jgi:phospholipase C
MTSTDRREFLRTLGGGAALAAMPVSIRKALALPAAQVTGTVKDVQHVVILMQENRSFDHYFGTMKGVRGFGDRHPVPMAGGKPIWRQADGQKEIPPFHLNTKTSNAMVVPSTPHSYADAQAAWSQGRFGQWPRFKTAYSMGYYKREDVPFQFALAEAFTLCDAYHCSVTSGTDPNRVAFWAGSNFDPAARLRGENCTEVNSEPNNLRCWIKGALPTPGYTYVANDLLWPTIPDVLEGAGVSWRIYQDPNNNWTGAMHGGLAFESFRKAKPGSPLYEKGMSHWSLAQLAEHVKAGTLPQVSWVLPPMDWSEHPGASTPAQGAEFTARVLDCLTSNPEVWAKTVFFQTFDENDGQFDHAPPPAPPSYNRDGSLAGKATLDLMGHYFSDPESKAIYKEDAYFTDAEGRRVFKEDTITGTLRPFGLGPRVPMYVVSPWSKGGWVSSEVFDHSSVGQFLETRFGVTIPGISPWHRAVCGDLTSCFDFATPNDPSFPALPDAKGSVQVVMGHIHRRPVNAPAKEEPLFQEPGTRPSRALPYALDVQGRADPAKAQLGLEFRNAGKVGAVFHVYDRLHLDRIPRRYTVEAGKALADAWELAPDAGAYDLWVYGPNGFVREFKGAVAAGGAVARPEIEVAYDAAKRTLAVTLRNSGAAACALTIRHNQYRADAPDNVALAPRGRAVRRWSLVDSHDWYDLTVAGDGFERRLAGRLETGRPGISDPAI